MMMEKSVVPVLESEVQKTRLKAPKEWPTEVAQVFEGMEEDFKRWMLDADEDNLPEGVSGFREYLMKEKGERGMENVTVDYVYKVLSNRLVAREIQQVVSGDPLDEDRLRELLKDFTDTLVKELEVPYSEALSVSDMGKEREEELLEDYGKHCDVYEAMMERRRQLIKARDKKKGDHAAGKIGEKIYELEKEMDKYGQEMDKIVDREDFPIMERIMINRYPAMILHNSPYERSAVERYLHRQRDGMAKHMWVLANILKTTNDINMMADRISEGWDFRARERIDQQKNRVSYLDQFGEPEVWEEATEELERMKKRSVQIRDIITEELIKVFEMEKPKIDQQMDRMKVKDIKNMLALTLDQIRGAENADNRRIITMDALAYLKFLEGRYRQVAGKAL